MADIARDAQNSAPRDPLVPVAPTVLSSYTEALDTVRAHVSWYLGYMDTYRLLVYITLGQTRGDVPGNCGVVEKAERGTDRVLRWMFVAFWCCICDICQVVHLGVTSTSCGSIC